MFYHYVTSFCLRSTFSLLTYHVTFGSGIPMILHSNLAFFPSGEYVSSILFMKVGGQPYLASKSFCLKLSKKETMYMYTLNIFSYIKSLKKNVPSKNQTKVCWLSVTLVYSPWIPVEPASRSGYWSSRPHPQSSQPYTWFCPHPLCEGHSRSAWRYQPPGSSGSVCVFPDRNMTLTVDVQLINDLKGKLLFTTLSLL